MSGCLDKDSVESRDRARDRLDGKRVGPEWSRTFSEQEFQFYFVLFVQLLCNAESAPTAKTGDDLSRPGIRTASHQHRMLYFGVYSYTAQLAGTPALTPVRVR